MVTGAVCVVLGFLLGHWNAGRITKTELHTAFVRGVDKGYRDAATVTRQGRAA